MRVFSGGSNTYNPGGNGNWNGNNHASYRRQASLTIEFTVTEAGDEFEDDDEPETEVNKNDI